MPSRRSRAAVEDRHPVGEAGEVAARPGRPSWRRRRRRPRSPAARQRLGARAAVVDAAAGELRDARARRGAGTGRRSRPRRVGRRSRRRRPGAARAPGRAPPGATASLHRQQLGAEALRLGRRAPGEVGARQADREAEVVLDARALAGLARPAPRARPARCAAPPTRRTPPPPARPGRRRRRPGRRTGRVGARGQADPLGHLQVGRRAQHVAVGEHQHRQRATGRRRRPPPARRASGSSSTSSQRYGHVVARQEVLQLVRLAREAVARRRGSRPRPSTPACQSESRSSITG